MSDRKSRKEREPAPDRLTRLEREAERAKKAAADSERRADKTLAQAEKLQEHDQELEAAEAELRRKAREPIGFPPPPNPREKR
jgi:hypothetical protein